METAIVNTQFLSPPEWPLDPTDAAPVAVGPAPGVVDLARVLQPFARWNDLPRSKKARLIRDSGVAVAALAGVPLGQIAPAAGVVKSRVSAIVGAVRHA